MITREADYAIRACLYLARHQDREGCVSTIELSEGMEIPYRFLRKIVRHLCQGGIIETRRGSAGGVRLVRKPEDVSLKAILELMDPRGLSLNACLADGKACTRTGYCKVHGEMRRLQSVLDNALADVTLATVL